MTLIAGFMSDECPIVMGDILISNNTESAQEMVFPTVGRVLAKHLSNGLHRPSKFLQKVNLLSPQLAIAWSGRRIYAQTFMRELIKARLHINPSREVMRDIYNGICVPGPESIIGIYRDGKELCLFGFNALTMEAPDQFTWIQAAGTGYLGFLKAISNTDAAVTSGVPNKLDKGIATAVRIITALLSDEIMTGIPLQDLYGAGYEILHPLGSHLAKFTGLSYVFWRSEEYEPGNWRLSVPFLVNNYSYQKDILVIRSVRISSHAKANSCKIDSDELHVVTPLYSDADYGEIVDYTPASLNTPYSCNIFLWKNHQGSTGAFSSYSRHANQSPPLIWTNEFKNNEGVDVNLEFVKTSMIEIATNSAVKE
jgi:hypothetical protein